MPVEITGLSEAPAAGDDVQRRGRRDAWPASWWSSARHEEKAKANAPVAKVSLEDLFSQIQAGEMKNLNLIVKADVQGCVPRP